MAGYVCAIAGGKGGVGRTTTAVNVGAVLQTDAGYDTVVVDADLAMSNVGRMLGVDSEATIHEVLAGNARVDEAIVQTADGLGVVAGAPALEAYAEANMANLDRVVDLLAEIHDVVLVDTGAGVGEEATVPMRLADGILVVTTTGQTALRSTHSTIQLAERIDGTVLGGIATRARGADELDRIEAELGIPALGLVPEHTGGSEEPLVTNSPSSPAAQAYQYLTAVLIRLFFQESDPADIEPTVEPAWFDPAIEAVVENEDGEETTGDDGVLGLFT